MKKRWVRPMLVPVLLAFLFAPATASSGAIHAVRWVAHDCVPLPSPCDTSIQAAVDAALTDDTIRVVQGVYLETVEVTKSVTLEGGWNKDGLSRDWDLYLTTIDAQRNGPVIWIKAAVSPTIEGFTITGGEDKGGDGHLGWGGGIKVYPTSGDGGTTLIRYNVITDNVGCSSCSSIGGQGGGIHVYNSSIIAEYNTVISNTARTGGTGGGEGGGVCVGWWAGATLVGNRILSNTAVLSPTGGWSGRGGGVYFDSHDLLLRDNEIRGNVAAVKGPGDGGGVYGEGGSLYDNDILSNTASISGTGRGGGIYAGWLQQVADNQIQGNEASRSADGSGGGIYALQLQDVYSNTIAGNQATRGGGLYLGQNSRTHLSSSLIARNRATGSNVATRDGGGGIASVDDEVEIVSNRIFQNSANNGLGGGLLLTGGEDLRVTDNRIWANTAVIAGGMLAYTVTGTIAHNLVLGNGALWSGGGVYLVGAGSPLMDGNVVMNNIAGGAGPGGLTGAGLILNTPASTRITLTNHIIAGNIVWSGAPGDKVGGVHCLGGSCALIHCTIVDNKTDLGKAEGVRIGAAGATNLVWNSIIAGHTTGVVLAGGAVASLGYNDYYENDVDTLGTDVGTNPRYDDPLFVDRAGKDYHLAAGSPLIDQADPAHSVPYDFEGEVRPVGPAGDIGADEFAYVVYLPLVFKGFHEGPGY